MRKTLPWIAVVAVLAGTTYLLRSQGRLWVCSCDYVLLWSGDAWSSDNSQHLLDPYSFTHVLHGFVLCGLLALVVPRVPAVWRLWLAVSVEALWEVVENSEFVIRRYREETAALGYTGDTVLNSLADIVLCGIGFALADRLGFRLTAALFVLTEAVLAVWIRDGLILNIIMLIHPIEAVREWQAAGH
ncbi:DUF2585 family protein [Rubrobacter tropicus]|uniref:DUF2585 family protein n=1 Tax=Rubrobacter tropicus TaxID=2653851 RepID=A0A6G8Q451_9ACTN|nr:DUF2585 family protein [Rubrobacter tropicus]QIN81252.1 DUF2585 family protein [Rubrobacter tropicus]